MRAFREQNRSTFSPTFRIQCQKHHLLSLDAFYNLLWEAPSTPYNLFPARCRENKATPSIRSNDHVPRSHIMMVLKLITCDCKVLTTQMAINAFHVLVLLPSLRPHPSMDTPTPKATLTMIPFCSASAQL